MKIVLVTAALLVLAGCSVFGDSGVEIAAYDVIEQAEDHNIDIRVYESLVLVSTPMDADIDESQRGPFMKLFDYISGDNVDRSEIAMTAPVFMDGKQAEGEKIAMTAPVFLDDSSDNATMSFVLPAKFTLETAPVPTNPDVKLEEITDYKVAVITFSGTMSDENMSTHRAKLEAWIAENGYTVAGPYKYAGYNPPFTLPAFRRNEVLIPVE